MTNSLTSMSTYFGEDYASAIAQINYLTVQADKDNNMLPDTAQVFALANIPLSQVSIAAVLKGSAAPNFDVNGLTIGSTYELFTRNGFEYMQHVEKHIASLSSDSIIIGGGLESRLCTKRRRFITVTSGINEITHDGSNKLAKPVRWYNVSVRDYSPFDGADGAERKLSTNHGIVTELQLFIEDGKFKMVDKSKGGNLDFVFLGSTEVVDDVLKHLQVTGFIDQYKRVLNSDVEALKLLKHPDVHSKHRGQLVFWVVARELKQQLIAARDAEAAVEASQPDTVSAEV